MDLNISKNLYEANYKDSMSFEAFTELLKTGLGVYEYVGDDAITHSAEASHIAMEYNIELLVKHLQD